MSKCAFLVKSQISQKYGQIVPTPCGSILHASRASHLPHNAKKAPAAAGKTSTGLIHVVESQELQFFGEKKAPAAAGKTSPGLDSQMALAIFVIGQILSQFEL